MKQCLIWHRCPKEVTADWSVQAKLWKTKPSRVEYLPPEAPPAEPEPLDVARARMGVADPLFGAVVKRLARAAGLEADQVLAELVNDSLQTSGHLS